MSNSRTLHPEDQIAQYRVVGPLGAGGMGEVYLAQDQSLERSVALKVLPNDLTRSDDRVRRFVQEAKSASSLNHPNIVTIYEIGQEPVKSASGGGTDSGPLHYISMELISGKTLSAKIHEEKTDLKSLVGYLAQAAEGIAKAHAVGIVHRDLKPGNIMVTDDGYAKVLDFGLAKLTEKSSGPNEATEIADRTTDGAVMGTVSYMSPEQVQGKPVDARADIFSFGCILYEAATRQRPFTADSNVEIMHKILHEKPRPVEELNPDAPAELRRVIRRCLAKQPEQRAQSMKDIAIELREIFDEYDALSASATSATLTAGGGVAPLSLRRKKRSMLPLVIALAVVAAGAVAFGVLRGGKKAAPQPFQSMRLTSETNRGDVLDAAISPDGRFLAYTAGKSGSTTLRVRQVATGSDVEVLPVQEGMIEFPCFTPDGNYLFYCRRKPDAPLYRQLMSVPSLGGQEEQRGFDVDSRVAFSPDGKRVAFVRGVPQKNYTAVLVLDLDSKQEKQLATIPFPGGPGGPASWSPDGKQIAIPIVTPPPGGGTVIRLFDASTGASRDLINRKGAFLSGVAWLHDGKGLALSGFDLGTTVSNQVFLLSYPGAEMHRVTNDFNNYGNLTTSSGDEAIATVRSTGLLNIYVSDIESGQERAITATVNPEQTPFSMATTNDRVYFTALRGEYSSLLSLPAAGGGEPVQISMKPGHCVQPTAANGVVLFRHIGTDQQGHIWKVDGNSAKQVTTGGGENLSDISPDGSMVAFSRTDSSRGMWVQPVDGGEAKLVSPTAIIQDGAAGGGFSSDGKFVGTLDFETDSKGLIRNVFKIVPVTGGATVTTLSLPQNAFNFENLPPHGILYISRADPHWNVFSFTVEQQTPVQLSHFTDGRVTDLRGAPDGKHVALVRRMPDGENVWIVNPDGSQPKQITHFSGLDVGQVRWMPDSKRIAIMAGHTGNDVAMIRNFR
jgi:Tol biopolymer transport system component